MSEVVINKFNGVQKFRTNATSTITNSSGADITIRLTLASNNDLHTIVDSETLSVPPGYVVEVIQDPDEAPTIVNILSYAQTDFEDVEADVNVSDKYLGKQVWDTTGGTPLWAAGADADDVWVSAAGATVYTPV